jgi:hypothetical protein
MTALAVLDHCRDLPCLSASQHLLHRRRRVRPAAASEVTLRGERVVAPMTLRLHGPTIAQTVRSIVAQAAHATVKVDFAIDGGEPLFVSIRHVVEPREIEVECDDPKDHRIETKGVNQNCQNDSRLESPLRGPRRRFLIRRPLLRSCVGHAPNRPTSVIGNQQRPVFHYCQRSGASPHLGTMLTRHPEARHEIFVPSLAYRP